MVRILKWIVILSFLLPISACFVFNLRQFPEKLALDKENRSRGTAVVAAIERFRTAQNRLPESLAEIRELQQIDVPTRAESEREFDYRVLPPDDYEVEFLEASSGTLTADAFYRYTSQTKQWEMVFP